MAMAAARENLRNQLALAVTSIQWSYGIFWSISSTQSGVLQLQWGDGYYNGDIKTRKTIQSIELDPDQMGLQRSEQLRELYASLATTGATNIQAKRPAAALSPEDLTDTEWYYLVCMSFAFNIGQGLPGKTYRNGQPIWVCDVDIADTKVFTRSLLAKSASIQTVVCFPFLDGVIELGVTDLVSEDLSLIHHIKTDFLERRYPIFSNNFLPESQNTQLIKEQQCIELEDEMILDTKFRPLTEFEVINMDSPNNSSNGFYPIQVADDCYMVDEIMNDEEFMNSSDCVSQSFIEVENVHNDDHCCEVEPKTDDLHFKTMLSSIFKASDQIGYQPHFRNGTKESSFDNWKPDDGFLGSYVNTGSGVKSQKLLKKVLFQVAKMHSDKLLETHEEDGEICRPEGEGIDVNNAVLEKRRRVKINERFSILRSLIPSRNKVDKVSVLDDTIEHLNELHKRVQDLDAITTRRHQDSSEKTRDTHKRKASDDDLDEIEPSIISRVSSKDFSSSNNISVSIIQKDVVVEINCYWRECLLFEIINAVSNIRLDSHSVQSSTSNGVLSVTIKSKIKGAKTLSAAKIRQTLERIVHYD